MSTNCSSRSFGLLPFGEAIEAWTLQGSGGLTLECLTYGGIVRRLLVPDREGRLDDVVLGLNTLEDYAKPHPHFGAITGRVAGRTSGASFRLDGKTYPLICNDSPNHLHGGIEGFYRKIWLATPVNRPDCAPSLRLTYCSPDGEEGYPGTVNVSVTYTITADNTFLIETEGTTDKPTPFNLAHHSYFNLAGESAGLIDDHELQIHADEAVAVDESMTLLGRRFHVAGQPNDLNVPRRLSDVIPQFFKRHGDLYLIRRNASSETVAPGFLTAARMTHPQTRRVLEVRTTEQYLQFYTGVSLDGTLTGKSGKAYTAHSGFCLEAEGYPDGANRPELGDIVLRPGRPVRHTTAYSFSTI